MCFFFKIPYISDIIWYLSSSDFLSMTVSRSILASASGIISFPFQLSNIPLGSLVAQMVKSLPAMQKTWVQSLGWEDRLENGVAACSSILAGTNPWTEEPGRLQTIG